MGFFGFFNREKKETLDKGLEKSKESVLSKIGHAIAGKSTIDDDVLDNLEEALITSDVGVETTLRIIERVQARVKKDKYIGTEELNRLLVDEISSLLQENNVADVPDFEAELPAKPYVIMVVGVNGVGKTTTIGKLAYQYKAAGKKVYLGAADTFRAAAVEQLCIWGERVGVPVIKQQQGSDPASVAFDTLQSAKANDADVVLIDTAGRLQIDDTLVQELVQVKKRLDPQEILLVGDSALGQEAVSVAEHFDQALGITGIILTKMDGDARGGAALSMHQVTGRPIKFVTVGERPIDLEQFHPDRMASRILGMGDIVSLVEKAAEQFEADEAEKLEERLRKNTFGFDDFLGQIAKIRKMGGLMSLLKFIPGFSNLPVNDMLSDASFNRIEGIINSMTPDERRHPENLSPSRRNRIAKGAGVPLSEVQTLIKNFMQMRQIMSQLGNGGGGLFGGGRLPQMPPMPGMGGIPTRMPAMPGTPQTLSAVQRSKNAAKKKKEKQARKQARKH